jgi:hypothetical protein
MFAPKVPKAQTKALENSSRKMPQQSTLLGHRLGHDPVKQVLFLQHTIGNQATLRLLAQQTSRQQGGATENTMTGEPSRGASWDFSKIPLFPPDRASRGSSPQPSVIQRKLVVGQPNDPLEHEADSVADQVMRMPAPEIEPAAAPPQVSRKCAACEEEEEANTLQTKPAGRAEPTRSEAPPIVHEVLRAPGRPLDAAVATLDPGEPLDAGTLAFMEPRFNYNFSKVRVHADSRAAESARSVNALAYTVGRDVVFGAGQYAPTTLSGRQLLAHELTHVVQQQATGHRRLDRQPAPGTKPTETYQTDVPILPPGHFEARAKFIYWVERVSSVFNVLGLPDRLFKDEDERDAVLAALWRVRPDKLSSTQTKYVRIPIVARSTKQSRELLYRFVFSPKGAGQTKDTVEVNFEAEDPKSVLAHAPQPPADYDPDSATRGGDSGGSTTTFRLFFRGFPGGITDLGEPEYWKQYPEEKRQVFYWADQQGAASFSQIVITRTTEGKGKPTAIRERLFSVTGARNKKRQLTELTVELLPPKVDLTQVWLPADYHSHDAGDVLIFQMQEQPDPNKKDHLGKVTLGTVPKEEAYSLKYMLWSYFIMGTRNAEVDAAITIPGTKRRVFYTLRFRDNNDVDVERIGEEGTEPKLDLQRLDIARAFGFESNADDPKKLKSWLKKRYPAITPTGDDPATLRESANKALQAGAGKPEWFRDNYKIVILDPADAEKRLAKTLKPKELPKKKDLLTGIKPFSADDFRLLELSLEPMSGNFLNLLRETRLVRKEVHLVLQAGGTVTRRPDVQGIAHGVGSEFTVVIYDSATGKSEALRFLGGKTNVLPVGAMTDIHELGHVVAAKRGIGAAFDQFVKDAGIQPFTPYAARDPQREFFAEAFFLFETDPDWLKSSHPDVFQWFETLSTTGKPPPRKKGP